MTFRKPVLNEDVLDYDTLQTDEINKNKVDEANFIEAKRFVVTDFLSGWKEIAADRKPTIIQTGNVIQITGAVRYGAVGGTAFSLPPEFRPATLMMFPCITSGGLGYIEVRPSGQVVPANGSDFFYLNSITYYRKKQ